MHNPTARRQLSVETLDARRVLSASGLGAGEVPDNIVSQQGDVVFVFGSDEDNSIEIELGAAQHKIVIDGQTHQYNAADVQQIVVSGGVGDDSLEVTGTEIEDRLRIRGDEVRMLGVRDSVEMKYQVRAQKVESLRFNGGTGLDTVGIHDSAGDDQLDLRPDRAQYTSGTLTVESTEFEQVQAFSTQGGADVVRFYDTPQDDRFVAKPDFSYMVGNGFSNFAQGFPRVEAYSEAGGSDEARLFDSDGDDLLIAKPAQTSLLVGGRTHVANNFAVTRAIASDGNDRAEMHGQDNVIDRLGWDPQSAYLWTTGQVLDGADVPGDFQPVTSVNLAVGFDLIEARADGKGDRAELQGSSGDDVFLGLPGLAELTTPDAKVEVGEFGLVRAFGRGGEDRAELIDSAFNDNYVGREDFSYMESPGYINYVNDFDYVDALALNGGYNYAESLEYSGPESDFLIHDAPQYMVYGPQRSERVYGFDKARGEGDKAGFQVLRNIINSFVLAGSHDNSELPEQVDVDAILERLAENVVSRQQQDDGSLNGAISIRETIDPKA